MPATRRAAVLALCFAACAHTEAISTGPTLELALDDARASERPLTPPKTYEMLMKFEPALPAFIPRRIRFLLAQPGHLVFTLYDTADGGVPGKALAVIDRSYEPAWASDGKDGRWVVEPLEVPAQHGPLFVGIHSPGGGGDPRLWASSTDTQRVFQRDADPNVPLTQSTIPRTPIVRLEVAPAGP